MMMLVSVIAPLLLASGVIVPAGAVPCSKTNAGPKQQTTDALGGHPSDGPLSNSNQSPVSGGPLLPSTNLEPPPPPKAKPKCRKRPSGNGSGDGPGPLGPPPENQDSANQRNPDEKPVEDTNRQGGGPGPGMPDSTSNENPGSKPKKPCPPKSKPATPPSEPGPRLGSNDENGTGVDGNDKSVDGKDDDSGRGGEGTGGPTDQQKQPVPQPPINPQQPQHDGSEDSGQDPVPDISNRMGDHPQSQDDKPKKGGDGQKPPATPQGPGESTAETNGTFGSGVKKGITAHVQYSSSVGVVGCELADGALERVAFFPGQPSCDNWCVKITNDNNGKSDYFLRIDGSTGAYDISCKGYDFLLDRENPKGCETAGHEEWTVADAEPENCRRFLKDGLMPTMTVNWPAECANSKTFGKGGPFRIKQLEGYQDQRCIGTSKEIKDPAYHAETLR